MNATKEQIATALQQVAAVADAIRGLGKVPNGELYAVLMANGMSIESYTAIIRTLKNAGLVTEELHVLKWVGPSLDSDKEAV